MRVKLEEWYAAALSFAYCFCVLAAYYVIRPIRDQLAAEVGSAQLPLFFGITFVVTLILTQLFALIVSKWPRRVVMPVIYLFFIVIQLCFIPLWYDRDILSVRTLGILFFVWVSVFNLFVVSVFWSFMTDIWSDEQARRLFPTIALGGTFGAILGPFITKTFVALLGSAWLLAVSATFLAISILCIILLGRWAHQFGANKNKFNNEAPIGGSMIDGIKQVFDNWFIATMCVIMLLGDAIGTIAYVLVLDYSSATFLHNSIEQTRFAASVDLWSNILQVFLQVFVTRYVLVNYGAGMVFASCAVVVVISCLAMTFSPDPFLPLIGIFPMVALVLIITRALAHSMLQAARESLYTLVPRDLRYKGKNVVDTVIWRIGDVMSLLFMNGLKSVGVTVAGFGIIWAGLAALSGWIGWRLSNRVEHGESEA